MNYLYTFVVCFLVIYVVYFLVVVNREKGLDKFKNGSQAEFFKKVYEIDFRKVNVKKFANSLALVNAFIMSFTVTVVELFENIVLKLIVGFVIIIPIMLICYKFLGQSYKKKEGN